MAKAHLSGQKKKRKRAREASPQRAGEGGLYESLATLQQQVGNRAVEQALARSSDRGLLRLDEGLTLRLTHPDRSPVPALTPAVGAAAQGPVQREESDAGQAQADTGTVTHAQVQYDWYDVSGDTLAEVAGQLDPDEWGHCEYHFDYSYETTNGRASKVDITLRLNIRLPRWSGRGWDRASAAAKEEWRRMLRALEQHEDEHANIARPWAPRFQERLLKQRENRLGQRHAAALQEVDRETRAFDQRTRHGQAQGVTLDLSIQ